MIFDALIDVLDFQIQLLKYKRAEMRKNLTKVCVEVCELKLKVRN